MICGLPSLPAARGMRLHRSGMVGGCWGATARVTARVALAKAHASRNVHPAGRQTRGTCRWNTQQLVSLVLALRVGKSWTPSTSSIGSRPSVRRNPLIAEVPYGTGSTRANRGVAQWTLGSQQAQKRFDLWGDLRGQPGLANPHSEGHYRRGAWQAAEPPAAVRLAANGRALLAASSSRPRD